MTTTFRPLISKSAEVSVCGRFRWWLRRSWTFHSPMFGHQRGRGVCCFVMLNPSTADASEDDPTIRRCIDFAMGWGFDSLSVRNLFPFRATDPQQLRRESRLTICGGSRGRTELLTALTADLVVMAWGVNGSLHDRDREFRDLVQESFSLVPIWCLGTTKSGHPRHPLYVSASQRLEPYRWEGCER